MNFENLAKSLIHPKSAIESSSGRSDDIFSEMARAGFSRKEIFEKFSDLYENAEDDAVRISILDKMTKVQGLYVQEETKKDIPSITINVTGDNARVMAMLCPPSAEDENAA